MPGRRGKLKPHKSKQDLDAESGRQKRAKTDFFALLRGKPKETEEEQAATAAAPDTGPMVGEEQKLTDHHQDGMDEGAGTTSHRHLNEAKQVHVDNAIDIDVGNDSDSSDDDSSVASDTAAAAVRGDAKEDTGTTNAPSDTADEPPDAASLVSLFVCICTRRILVSRLYIIKNHHVSTFLRHFQHMSRYRSIPLTHHLFIC